MTLICKHKKWTSHSKNSSKKDKFDTQILMMYTLFIETCCISDGKSGPVSRRRVEYEPGQTQEGRANFSVSP